jgi:hypothetical protein
MAATQDLFHDIAAVSSVDPVSITSDTTTTGASVDTDEGMSVTALMQVGAYSAGNFELEVEESYNGTDWSPVDDDDLLGTEAETNLSGAGVASIGYVGGARYVRFNVVSAGGADATVSCAAVKGHLYHSPDSNQTVS